MALVLHFLVTYQRRVVGKDDVALVALVAVLMLQVVVHRPLVLRGKCLVAQLADVLAGFL